jgi:hypothetical protein
MLVAACSRRVRGVSGGRAAVGLRRAGLGLVFVMVALGFLCVPLSAMAAGGEAGCENEALRTSFGWLALPDCRAYEMVSPPYKEGYPMFAKSYSTDGGKAILFSLANLAGTPGAGESAVENVLYLDRRTAAGWQISPLNASSSEFVGQVPVAVEAETGATLWEQHTPGQSKFTVGLYHRSATGVFSLMGRLNLPREVEEEEASDVMNLSPEHFDVPVAATSDYQHVLLFGVLSEDYWPFDLTQGTKGSLYEYSGLGNSEPVLVGVTGGKGSRQLVGLCGTHLGGIGSTYNALSGDGETVFFTVFPGCGAPASAEVYARLHGSLSSPAVASTVDVSASECAVACGGESGKNFEGASEDGQRVFFTSTQKLTDDAVDGTASGNAADEMGCSLTVAGGGGCNLYEYDFGGLEGARLRLVAGGEVLGVSGVAEDGSRVYFVSRTALGSAGENEYGKSPQEGQPNLYAYDASSGGTAFIATLGGADGGDWTSIFGFRPVEVAGKDGSFLLFASSMPGLTPDDTSGVEQLFEYDAVSGELVRVTKGEDGYNEDGNGVATGVQLGPIEGIAERLGNGSDFKDGTNRLQIAEDGKTIFFEARGQLSPRATSAVQECRNIYEFHSGSGIAQGSVHLVSDGRDTQLYKGVVCGPQFQAMDGGGANVLFVTDDPLVPGDVDGVQRDVYDARVGGGFALAPRGEVGLCEPGGCEGPSSGVPAAPVLDTVRRGEAGVSPAVSRGVVKSSGGRKGASGGGGRLARALRACRGKARGRRSVCEVSARRRFGSRVKAKKSMGRG